MLHQVKTDVRLKLEANIFTTRRGADRHAMIDNCGVNVKQKGAVKKMVRRRPQSGRRKLNSYGSILNDKGIWAAVIRDEGVIRYAAKGRNLYNIIELVELEGVLDGVQLAIKYGDTKLEVSTDSTCVVAYYTMKNPPGRLGK